MRYDIEVKVSVDRLYETVNFIDWDNPGDNDLAVAEEVTLRGDNERRPDVVLYINGIAFGVIELKNSRVSVESGIRQNLSSQLPEFNALFFSTVQLVFAGNGSQGFRYGTILAPEKFFASWKEDEADNARIKLDKYLLKMCDKVRVNELMRDFILFYVGQKKIAPSHQYLAVRAAQARLVGFEGGVIWHRETSSEESCGGFSTAWWWPT